MINSEDVVTAKFDINEPDEDTNYIVYAKLTDNAGNVKYLSTNGIVMDVNAPVIKAGETTLINGSTTTYTTKQKITVTDTNLDKVTVTKNNGETISTEDKDIQDENHQNGADSADRRGEKGSR